MSGVTSNNNKGVDESNEGIGQGELYSPDHAIKINTKENNTFIKQSNFHNNHHNLAEEKGRAMVGRGVATDIKNRMGMVKDRVIEKLVAASVPSDALENARSYFESMIRDVTSAAQGITKEALQRIKSHLADILPSVSPTLTSKMVDDADKEVAGESEHTCNKEKGDDNLELQKTKVSDNAAVQNSSSSSYQVKPVSKM